MTKEKKEIYYIVMIISMFAKDVKYTIREAFLYLNKYGAMTFLTDNYEAEHLLSENEVLEDLKEICRKNGGSL